ncbi:MAG: hypothetical protein Q7R83_03445 [bacterium]|nr:hypothetical protein [bacterium]
MQNGLDFEHDVVLQARDAGIEATVCKQWDHRDKIDVAFLSDQGVPFLFAIRYQLTLMMNIQSARQSKGLDKVREFFRLHPNQPDSADRAIDVFAVFDQRHVSASDAVKVLIRVARNLQQETKKTAFWLLVHGPNTYELLDWEQTLQRLAIAEVFHPLQTDERVGIVERHTDKGVIIRSGNDAAATKVTIYLLADRFMGPQLAEYIRKVRAEEQAPVEGLAVRFTPGRTDGARRYVERAELIPVQHGFVVDYDDAAVTIRTSRGQEWQAPAHDVSPIVRQLLRVRRTPPGRPLDVRFYGLLTVKSKIGRAYRVTLKLPA